MNVMDIHIVDFLSDKERDAHNEGKSYALRHSGVAYARFIVDWLYRDLQYRPTLKASELINDSVIIAAKSVLSNRSVIVDPKKKRRKVGHQLSLLAHEMGHILADPQRPGLNDMYIDHYCPEKEMSCDTQNLMSTGGTPEFRIYPLENRRGTYPIGFSALPYLENAQCQSVLAHELIKKRP